MWVIISGLELVICSNYDDDDLVEQLFTIFNWHSIFNAQTREFVCITQISFLINENVWLSRQSSAWERDCVWWTPQVAPIIFELVVRANVIVAMSNTQMHTH